MIRTSRDDIPRSTEGSPPDRNPRFVTALAEEWYRQYLERGDDQRATANGSLLRGSDAARCGRALSYSIRQRRGEEGMESTNPPSIADAWRFGIGSMIHEMFGPAIEKAFPGAECEVVGVFDTPDLSLHADFVVTHEDQTRTLVELKSTNGFSFKMQATSGRTPPEGPKLSAFLQGAMGALALDCDEMVIAVVSLELLSPAEAAKQKVDEIGRFGAEWAYSRAEFEPPARAELARLDAILQATLAGEPVRRLIPDYPLGAEVIDPATGRWELRNPEGTAILDSGLAWNCRYCDWQDRCSADKKAGL